MMQIAEITDKKTWEDFILTNHQQNFLQSWYWGESQQNFGNKIFRFGFFSPKLQGVCLLIKQPAKRGDYLECPGGPIIDWQKKIYFEEFVHLVKEIGRKEKCWFVRIRPQILDNPENRQLFTSFGFVNAPMHLHAETTWQLDIAKDEKQLLAGMRKTTRYLIKKAIKDKVRVVQSKNIADIEILYNLQMETAKRHHFTPFSREYFLEQFKSFIKDDKISLFKAYWQNEVVTISFIIFYHKMAVYHYSGSSSRFAKIPASYLLQWEAIKEAKKRGCQIYNFWGIAPTDNPKHRFAGVTLFKKGFGGFRVDYLHAQDLPLESWYWSTYIFESLRRKLRRL